MEYKDVIKVKGDRNGIKLTVSDEVSWEKVIDAIKGFLKEGGSLLKGARITLNFQKRDMSFEEWIEITKLFWEEADVYIVGVETDSKVSIDLFRRLGLLPLREQKVTDTLLDTDTYSAYNRDTFAEKVEGTTLIVKKSLRSGQRIDHDGDVVIIGDVHRGAEVVAEGSVFVWGTLSGLVHAGSGGDSDKIIAALRLNPTQVRIGTLVGRFDTDSPKPEGPAWVEISGPNIVIHTIE